MLSIVYNVKNRSSIKFHYDWTDTTYNLSLFPTSFKSLINTLSENSIEPGDIEIIIADWNSTDIDIEEFTSSLNSKYTIKIIQITGEYNTSTGKNMGAKIAHGDYIFFLDADMEIREDCELIKHIQHMISRNVSVYFPHCRYGLNPNNTILSGYVESAFGNMLINKIIFDRVQFRPEDALKHQEDVFYYQWVNNVPGRYAVKEDCVDYFVHQFHPRGRRCYD